MRDVTIQLAPPPELLKRIRDPERFRPKPRVVGLPPLRRLESGQHEIMLNEEDRWRKVHAMIVALHESLRVGEEADVAHLTSLVVPHLPRPDRAVAEGVTRNFLLALHKNGYLDLRFEEPPPVFDGRYERVKELGRGGMGIAHLCRDRDTGEEVVIKHAWGWSRPIEKAEASIRQEAAVLRNFDHPRIPPLVDAFEVDGILHMVRLFAPGVPITKTTPRPWDLTVRERGSIIRGIGEAVAHVHDRGFLYLDVKPANAVIGTLDEGPMLLDFGVCRAAPGGVVRTRGIVGSKGYIAPELKDLTASVRSDIYSLGRTWYQLATGHKPRPKYKAPEIAVKMRDLGVDEAEREAILRFTSIDPAGRPASMREALDIIPA